MARAGIMVAWAMVGLGVMGALARGEEIVVKGRVVDSEGKPVAGAVVVVPAGDWRTEKAAARGISGQEGTFEVSFTRDAVSSHSPSGKIIVEDQWKRAQVGAWKAGYGVGWKVWSKVEADGELKIQLARDDQPLEGRLMDDQGKGMAGVRVEVSGVSLVDPAADYAIWEKDPMEGAGISFGQMESLFRWKEVVTDGEGRFRAEGLGRDRWVWMTVRGPGVAYERVYAMTKTGERQKVTVGKSPEYEITVEPTEFVHRVKPGVSVQGMVKDVTTGEALGGVEVVSWQFAVNDPAVSPFETLKTMTDAQGHYRLDGFPKGAVNGGDKNRIRVKPNGEQAFFERTVTVPEAEGMAEVNVDLHEGVWIRGTVKEKGTGRPLVGEVYYSTYLDNAEAKGVEGFELFTMKNGEVRGSHQESVYAGTDGSYKLLAVPGKAVLGVVCELAVYRVGVGFKEIWAYSDPKGRYARLYGGGPGPDYCNVGKEIDVGAAGAVCDFEVDPGSVIKAVAVDAKGEVVAGEVKVAGWSATSGMWMKEMEGKGFELLGFGPGDERWVAVVSEKLGLGLVRQVKAEEKEVKLALLPLATIKGRVISAGDRTPIAGESMRGATEEGDSLKVAPGETDAKGAFELKVPVKSEGVETYTVEGLQNFPALKQHVKVKAGETVDIGVIRIRR